MAKKRSKGKRERSAKAEAAMQRKAQARRERVMRKKGKNRGSGKDSAWRADFDKFCEQLRPFGLVIRDVRGDGNCLFRAIADQLEGNEHLHTTYRARVCNYMEENPDNFQPFVFDQDYASYLKDMRQDGEWGGNLEIAAISQACDVNITIHQLGQPRWEVKNPNNSKARGVHLSYHDGQHYSSVRKLGEPRTRGEAPTEIKIFSKMDASRGGGGGAEPDKRFRIISETTGCRNARFVREALEDNGGDVEAAIEYLISMREAGVDDFFRVVEDASDGKAAACDDANIVEAKATPTPPTKKPNRNGPCYCKSGKKYKNCCAVLDKVKRQKARRGQRTPSPSKRGGRGSKSRVQSLTNKQRKELNRKRKEDARKSKGKKEQRAGDDRGAMGADDDDDISDLAAVDLGSLCI